MLTFILVGLALAMSAVLIRVCFEPLWRLRRDVRQLSEIGVGEVGRVLAIEQTGTEINDQPEMRVELDIHPAGGVRRQVTVKQLTDMGSIPRVGDLIYLVTDPEDPTRVVIAGGPTSQPTILRPDPEPPQRTDAQELDLMALTARLREHGVRAVATVLAVEAGGGQATRFSLEVDSILEVKRRVVVEQVMYGQTYAAGERAYLLVDPDDRDMIALLPLSLSGGEKPDPKHRLDKHVLAPQLLREGAKGRGVILSAERIAAPVLEGMGHAKIRLRVHITPDDGSEPYDAEQEMIFSSEEKVQHWGVVGAEMPVRYDWHDRMMFMGDLMSLGHPDPFIEFEKADRARRAAYQAAHQPAP